MKKESASHPEYYGGEENPYEAIKVIEAWDLNFNLGNVLKYINRAGKKSEDPIKDLEKAVDYLGFEVKRMKRLDRKSRKQAV